MFEQRWYKAAIINRIRDLISKYDMDPDDQFKLRIKILDKIGLAQSEGVFVKHLWIDKFDDLLAEPFLTLCFYKNLNLPIYSMEMLLKFLEEVESAASILSDVSKDSRESKIMKDGLRILSFIDKIKGSFREIVANQKLALESS
jgi:hypothetical protein